MSANSTSSDPRTALTDRQNQDRYSTELTLTELALILVHRRSILFATVLVGLGIGLLVAFLSPSVYRAQTRVVPNVYFGSSTDLQTLMQMQSAANRLALSLSGTPSNPSPLFPQILSSRDLIMRLLARSYMSSDGKSVDLTTYMRIKARSPDQKRERAIAAVRSVLRSGYDMKSGVTTISAAFRDPSLAAVVANAATEELDLFMQSLKSSQAGEKVRFISQRLTEVQTQLAETEEALKQFRERNRLISGSPYLLLEESRLLRDQTVNEQLFLTLRTQLEVARIDEVRDVPDLIVIEKASPPLYRDSPKRRRVLVLWVLLSGALGVILSFSAHYFAQIRSPSSSGIAGT